MFIKALPYLLGWVLLTVPYILSKWFIKSARAKKAGPASTATSIWLYLSNALVAALVVAVVTKGHGGDIFIIWIVMVVVSSIAGTAVGLEWDKKATPLDRAVENRENEDAGKKEEI